VPCPGPAPYYSPSLRHPRRTRSFQTQRATAGPIHTGIGQRKTVQQSFCAMVRPSPSRQLVLSLCTIKIMNNRRQSGDVLEFQVTNPFLISARTTKIVRHNVSIKELKPMSLMRQSRSHPRFNPLFRAGGLQPIYHRLPEPRVYHRLRASTVICNQSNR
jgi:hypothetical protein